MKYYIVETWEPYDPPTIGAINTSKQGAIREALVIALDNKYINVTEQLRYLRACIKGLYRDSSEDVKSPEMFIGIRIIETNATGLVLSKQDCGNELLDVVAIQQQEILDEKRERQRVHVFKAHDSTKRLHWY